MQNFSYLACIQTDLDKFLTFFQEKIKIFYNFPNLKKVLNRDSQKASFQKNLTPYFLKEFQNSEYEVHKVGSNEASSQNFSFLELNTAGRAAPQISFKNRRQRRVTDGKNVFALNSILGIKSPETWKFTIKKNIASETNTSHIS
jgi:hypothetical protein